MVAGLEQGRDAEEARALHAEQGDDDLANKTLRTHSTDGLAMGYIYRLVFPSGKCYVGQTIGTVQARWRGHKNSSNKKGANCRLLKNAIAKYGWKYVKKEVVTKPYNSELDVS